MRPDGAPGRTGGRPGEERCDALTLVLPTRNEVVLEPALYNGPIPERIRRRDRDARSRTVFRVDELGDPAGEPIVFLHGLLGLNEHWFPVARLASTGADGRPRRCLMVETPLLELRGDACSVQGVTRLITSVIESIAGAPAVIVGNSFGGHVAQRVALERPELVRALVLAGSSGLFERTLEKGVEHRPSRAWLERKITELFCDATRVPHDCVDRAFEALSDRRAARSFVRLGRSAKQDNLGPRLGEIPHPTLLLWGRQDIVTPPAVAEEFHTLIPDTRLVWIERCGHAPMIERPEEFAGSLEEFLAALPALPEQADDAETREDL